jgi:hypothetical protein
VNPVEQRVQGEWLDDKVVRLAAMDCREGALWRIAAHKENLEVRTPPPGGLSELAAVQHWQADIGDEEVDVRLGIEDFQACGPVRRRDGAKPLVL